MSITNQYTTGRHRLDAKRIFHIFTLSAVVFVAVVSAFLMLQRIGLPPSLLLLLSIVAFLAALISLSWFGRTMLRQQFFFAGRRAFTSSIGLGATTDWIGGAFLILFLSTSLLGKLLLAPAIMIGLFFQTVFFTIYFHRSGASTLPGFFAWRMRGQKTALVALIPTSIMLVLLIVAEFLVTRDMLALLTGFELSTVVIFVIAIAILPSLTGGWLSLLIINGVLAVGMLVGLLIPSTAVGFLPGLLESEAALQFSTSPLPALTAEADGVLGFVSRDHDAFTLLTTLLVLAAGFTVLPHALSRGTLNVRDIGAAESLGWTALVAFLIFSALPLSLGLIGPNPTSPKLALLLQGNPVLHMLPYFVLLMAATGALATTIYALSSALVRSVRRSRNLDPGEQSLFTVRVLVIVLGVSLYYLPENEILVPGQLFVMALSLGAASLFMPLLAAIWFPSLPKATLALAIICGGAVVVAKTYGVPFVTDLEFIEAGGLGFLTSGAVILLGWIMTFVLKSKGDDIRLLQLRNPNMEV